MRVKLLLFLSVGFFMSCKPDPFPRSEEEGYRPVYGDGIKMEIKFLPPQELKEPGKIYTYKKFLFVNDLFKGVHVFNNEDPSSPKPIGFLQIPGNINIAIKDSIMYADNYSNLVLLNIGNPNDIKIANILSDMFPLKNLNLPPAYGTYFECVDDQKGVIIGWEKTTLKNPQCYREWEWD